MMRRREWVQSDRRAENPDMRKKEDKLRLDSCIQIRSTGWDEIKSRGIVLLARRPPAFHWKTLRDSGRRRGSRRCRETSRSKRGRWGCRGRTYEVSGKRIRGLKVRVGWECCISRGGPDGPDWAVEVYKLKESEKEVTVLVGVRSPEKVGTHQGGQLQEWELPRVLNLEKESSKHFKWTHL